MAAMKKTMETATAKCCGQEGGGRGGDRRLVDSVWTGQLYEGKHCSSEEEDHEVLKIQNRQG